MGFDISGASHLCVAASARFNPPLPDAADIARVLTLFVNPLTRAWRMGFVENGTIWERARAVNYYTANNGGGAGGPGRGNKRSRGRGGAGAPRGVGGGAADAAGRGSGGGVRGGGEMRVGRGRGGGAAVQLPDGQLRNAQNAQPRLTIEQLRDAQNAQPATPPRGGAAAQ